MERYQFSAEVLPYRISNKNNGKVVTMAFAHKITPENDVFEGLGISCARYLQGTKTDRNVTLRADKSKEVSGLFKKPMNLIVMKPENKGPDQTFKSIIVKSGRIVFTGKGERREASLVFKIDYVCDTELNTWLFQRLNSFVLCELQPIQGELPLGKK